MPKYSLLGLIFFILVGAIDSVHGAGQDVVTVNQEGSSASEVPSQARTEALNAALENGTLSVVTQLLGAAQVEKNQNQIKSRVLTESSKYIQFYKASEPILMAGQTTIKVTMKVSVSALREILDRAGLLIQDLDSITILPLIKITEKRTKSLRSYVWWKDEDARQPPFVKDQFKFFNQFWNNLDAKSYKFLDPTGGKLYPAVLDQYKKDSLSPEEMILLAQGFRTQLVAGGEILVTEAERAQRTKATAKIAVYNVATGKLIFENTKSYEISNVQAAGKINFDSTLQQVLRSCFTDTAKSIFAQLQDGFKRGLFGSQTVKFGLRGVIGYQDLEDIKKELLLRLPEVRAMRERTMQRGYMVLEGEVVGSLGSLVKKIEGLTFDGFELRVQNSSADQVDMSWSRVQKRGR